MEPRGFRTADVAIFAGAVVTEDDNARLHTYLRDRGYAFSVLDTEQTLLYGSWSCSFGDEAAAAARALGLPDADGFHKIFGVRFTATPGPIADLPGAIFVGTFVARLTARMARWDTYEVVPAALVELDREAASGLGYWWRDVLAEAGAAAPTEPPGRRTDVLFTATARGRFVAARPDADTLAAVAARFTDALDDAPHLDGAPARLRRLALRGLVLIVSVEVTSIFVIDVR